MRARVACKSRALWAKLAALLGVAVAALALSTTALVTPRIDLTADKVFTLSQGTRDMLADLEQPVELWWFYSEQQLREAPSLRNYALRVENLLTEMTRLAGGKLSLRLVDPAPFSVAEDRATQWGLQAVPVAAGQPALYLGLAAIGANGNEEVIPFLHPNRQRFLEYDVARAIARSARVRPPTIGLISSLPVNGGVDVAQRTVHRPWTALRELGESYNVEDLGTSVTDIPSAIDVLLLIQPGPLSASALFAIDQFVLAGKPALIFLDPDPQSAGYPLAKLAPSAGQDDGGLHTLLRAWGVDGSADQVVGDAVHAMLVNIGDDKMPARDLTLLGLGRDAMAGDHAMTRDLETLNLATAGTWQARADASSVWQPLVWSSTGSALINRNRLAGLEDPNELLQGFVPDGRRHAIMGLLTGVVDSATQGRDPGGAPGGLTQGAITVLLVGDTDLLTDRLWVQVQGFLGQPVLAPFADNGSLLINAADFLTGSQELIGLRGRGTLERPFTRFQALRQQAELRYRDQAEVLTGQLEEAEQGLAALQAQATAGGKSRLGPEQQALATQYIDRKLALREALREVQRQLNAEIDVLAARLKAINIALVPALLTLLLLAWQLFRRWQLRLLQAPG